MATQRRPTLATFGIFALVGCGMASGAEDPLTLTAAVELATTNSPGLLARQAAVQAADALADSAGRLPDPELIVGLTDVPVTGDRAFSLSRDEFTGRRIGVMQSLPRKLKRDLNRQRASNLVGLARALQSNDILSVKREVALSWIAASSAEQARRQLQALEPLLILQVKAAEAGVAGGKLSTTDVLAAQAALVEFRDRQKVADQAVRRARLELQRWLPEDGNRALVALPAFNQMPIDTAGLLSGVHDHAEVRAFDAQLDMARTDIALALADKRADWSVQLDYAQRAAPFSDMLSLEFRIGLPLFSQHRQDPVIASKRAALREVEAEREATIRMHSAEIAQVITDWEVLKSRLATYETELVPLSHARAQAAMAAFQASTSALKPVLEARAQEIEAQLRMLELHSQLGRSWVYLTYLRDSGSAP